jgi:hypothetical protein
MNARVKEGNQHCKTQYCRQDAGNQSLINYEDAKAKCRNLKKIYLQRDFVAGIYQSL